MTPLLNLILVLTGGCNTTSPLPSPLGLNYISVPFSLLNGNSSAISGPNCDCKCDGIPILPNTCEMLRKLGLCNGENTTSNKTEEITTTLSSAISTTVSPEMKDITTKNDTIKMLDDKPPLDLSDSKGEDRMFIPGVTKDKNVTSSGDGTTEKFTTVETPTTPKPSNRTPKEETTEPSKKDETEKFSTERSSEGIITPLGVTTLSPEKTSPKFVDDEPRDVESKFSAVSEPTADTNTTSTPLPLTKNGVTTTEETSKVPSEDDKKTTEPKSPESSTKDSEDNMMMCDSTPGVTESNHTTLSSAISTTVSPEIKDITTKNDTAKTLDDKPPLDLSDSEGEDRMFIPGVTKDKNVTSSGDGTTEKFTTVETPTTPKPSDRTPKEERTEPSKKDETEKFSTERSSEGIITPLGVTTLSPEKTSPKFVDDEPRDVESEFSAVSEPTADTNTTSTPLPLTKNGVTTTEETSKVPSEDDKKTTEPKSPESSTKDSEDNMMMCDSPPGVTESSHTTAKKDESASGGHTDDDRDDKTLKTPEALTTTTESVPSEETPKPENPKSDLDNCLKVDKDTIDKLENITMQPLEKKALKKIINSINKFSLDLTKAVLKDNTTNYAIAPINFALLLLMAENGACKDTKKELDNTLHLSKEISKEELRPIKFLVDSLKDMNKTTLILGDKIFLPQNVEISPEYRNLIQDTYQSDPISVDYKKGNDAVEQINRWVANKTNNYAQKVISNSEHEVVNENTSLILAGVGYLQTNWVYPFDQLFNDQKLFYIGNNTYKYVCTMLQIHAFRYYHMNYLSAAVIELPLKANKYQELKMIVVLPDKEKNLSDVLKHLNKFQYTDFNHHAKVKIVELSLPKFKIQSFIDLHNYSDKININKTMDNSNLCCVSEKAKISRVLQKTVLRVNEGDCVRPYYSCKGDDNSCMNHKIKFTVNRPFIFFIIKDETIIFSGQIIDPSHN
ncbi:muscle M-line assembly protein unc-89-like [Cotesia glomerata]|uniref:muscle M-line assembly protein unc-89-like n=1 Tax=Cotesia glomerata TaxID=32391 RepID=UPI001D009716|nr:muscle M-line assembly protein unc-89-like [Cotesia glomerata]